MTQENSQKDFDSLIYKEEVQAEIFDEIKDLSRSERVEYFRNAQFLFECPGDLLGSGRASEYGSVELSEPTF